MKKLFLLANAYLICIQLFAQTTSYKKTFDYDPGQVGCSYSLSVNVTVSVINTVDQPFGGITVYFDVPTIVKLKAVKYYDQVIAAENLPANLVQQYTQPFTNETVFNFQVYKAVNPGKYIRWSEVLGEPWPESKQERQAMHERGVRLFEQNAFSPKNIQISAATRLAFNSEPIITYLNDKKKQIANPASRNNSSYGNSNSVNKVSSTTTETSTQRQYREQQERIAETQRQTEEKSKQLVNNATQLVAMASNIFADAREAKERKEAKKAEERALKEKEEKDNRMRFWRESNNAKEVIKIASPGAERGQINDIILMYEAYEKGWGWTGEDYKEYKNNVDKWVRKATEYYEKELASGDSSVLKVIAETNFEHGYGNFGIAVFWLEKYMKYHPNAAVQMFNLGRLNYFGRKLSSYEQTFNLGGTLKDKPDERNQNKERAIYWLEMAAKNGNQEAKIYLYDIYWLGNNGFKDYMNRKKAKAVYK